MQGGEYYYSSNKCVSEYVALQERDWPPSPNCGFPTIGRPGPGCWTIWASGMIQEGFSYVLTQTPKVPKKVTFSNCDPGILVS